MKIVVDASVAVKWVVDENDADLALGLFDTTSDLFAPDFLLVEVGNVLWKKVRRREITAPQADEAIGKIEAFFDDLAPTRPLVPRALSIATEIDHPIYDCIYLAFAEQLDAALVTGDRRLRSKALGLPSIRVHPLTSSAPSPH